MNVYDPEVRRKIIFCFLLGECFMFSIVVPLLLSPLQVIAVCVIDLTLWMATDNIKALCCVGGLSL